MSIYSNYKKMLAIMWHEKNKEPLRIFYKSYARYKKHGVQGMTDRLEREYSRLYPQGSPTKVDNYKLYQDWILQNEQDILKTEELEYMPLVSIVTPTYNTDPKYLKKMLDSVLAQTYKHWELCIADDASTDKNTLNLIHKYETAHSNIKVTYRKTNGHISEASNSALALATGKYIALLDHDDTLAPNALYEMVKKLNVNPKLKLIYSDEDKIDENDNRYNPHFKSGWNPDMFFSQNYITHLTFIKKDIVDKIGGFRIGYEGSQDYDLLLRSLTCIDYKEIDRVEKVLYHWRAIKGSTAYGSGEKSYAHDAGLRALQDYFAKKDSLIEVEDGLLPNTYKVNYPYSRHSQLDWESSLYPNQTTVTQDQTTVTPDQTTVNQKTTTINPNKTTVNQNTTTINPNQTTVTPDQTTVILSSTGDLVYPLVTLLIPTRDGYDILHKCVNSILEKTTYKNYEIIVLDNETTCKKTLEYFKKIKKHKNISVLEYYHPFNYSAINNFGVKHAKGEIIGLINNDVEVISKGWLSEMVQHAIRPEIGAVGAKLYYDNDTIQHAGVLLGIGGVAGHSHKYFHKEEYGYFSRLKIIQNYSAVTGACLVVRKKLYEEVGGLDELNLKVAFNDVDFCLKLLEKGYRNLWTPYVELYHHESISRGSDENEEKRLRFQSEVIYMKNVWLSELKGDFYYNFNLTYKNENFGLNI